MPRDIVSGIPEDLVDLVPRMPHDDRETAHTDEWLSLQAASEQLGVATSTLRRWGDEGRVLMKRTLGGHRRFGAAAIARLQQHPAQVVVAPALPTQPWGVDEHELARQQWHARLTHDGGSDRMRGLGQRLLGLLMQYINRGNDDARFLAEARGVGSSYGTQAHAAGASLHDTVEAFLFFRGSFVQLAQPLPGIAQPTDLDAAALLRGRIDRFMDAVLLGLIDGYQKHDI